ncbi:MAG TPA: hypothetical protein VIN36_04340, partial [Thiobacillus sp.]
PATTSMALSLIILLPLFGALLPPLFLCLGRTVCAWSTALLTGTALAILLYHSPPVPRAIRPITLR